MKTHRKVERNQEKTITHLTNIEFAVQEWNTSQFFLENIK